MKKAKLIFFYTFFVLTATCSIIGILYLLEVPFIKIRSEFSSVFISTFIISLGAAVMGLVKISFFDAPNVTQEKSKEPTNSIVEENLRLFTEWKINNNSYKEDLIIQILSDSTIKGTRKTFRHDNKERAFNVYGNRIAGYLFMVYENSSTQNKGGGVILLRPKNTEDKVGIIVNPNCDTGDIYTFENVWIDYNRANEYKSNFQKSVYINKKEQ